MDKLEWKRGKNRKDFLICENKNFARVVNVMVTKFGKWDHDEIIFIEPSSNVVVVPVYNSRKIYLHQEYRPKVMKPGTKIKPLKFGKVKIESLGRWSIEVPRGGFDSKEDKDSVDAAVREVKEETGIEIKRKDMVKIGEINPNTAYATSTIPVYFANCKKLNVTERTLGEEKEKIKSGMWYSIKEVKKMIRDKKIFCGVTLAAINLFFHNYEKK